MKKKLLKKKVKKSIKASRKPATFYDNLDDTALARQLKIRKELEDDLKNKTTSDTIGGLESDNSTRRYRLKQIEKRIIENIEYGKKEGKPKKAKKGKK